MARRSVLVFLGVAAFILSFSAVGGAEESLREMMDGSKQPIAKYTEALQDQSLTATQRSAYLAKRAQEYILLEKDMDRAKRDIAEAIKLDPNNAFAYFWRVAFATTYDAAMQDTSKAIALDPVNMVYRNQRIRLIHSKYLMAGLFMMKYPASAYDFPDVLSAEAEKELPGVRQAMVMYQEDLAAVLREDKNPIGFLTTNLSLSLYLLGEHDAADKYIVDDEWLVGSANKIAEKKYGEAIDLLSKVHDKFLAHYLTAKAYMLQCDGTHAEVSAARAIRHSPKEKARVDHMMSVLKARCN